MNYPYYPEDINDEVYPGENFEILSPRGNFMTYSFFSPSFSFSFLAK